MNIDQPLVTIQMPAYNHEDYIERAINSIMNQTYNNIQLVVIDDGSTDSTPQILERLSTKYEFYYEHQENRGLTATLNKLHENHTNGKYVRVCASDDEMPPNALKTMVDFMESNPIYGASYGHAHVIDETSSIIGKRLGSGSSGWLYEKLLIGQAYIPLITMMWKTEILDSVLPYNENISTEDIFLIRKVSKICQIGFVDSFVHRYRKHEVSMSSDHWKMYIDSRKVVEGELKEIVDPQLRHRYLRIQQLYWFYSLSRNYKREAMKYFLPAVNSFPSKFFVFGCLNLIGAGFIERLFRQIKSYIVSGRMNELES